jgi:HPt (histidine-containing phosphotransfer) domain-containing protein
VAAVRSGGAVDFGYLESYAGDAAVVAEILDMFQAQAAKWTPQLDAGDPAWRDVVHTIKGTARGIGAGALGDACALAEAEGPERLGEVRAELAAALAAIADYQAKRTA